MEGAYLRLFARTNAKGLIERHGRDAEAVSMGHAKSCLEHGNMDALRVNLEVLREIRRRLKRRKQEWTGGLA